MFKSWILTMNDAVFLVPSQFVFVCNFLCCIQDSHEIRFNDSTSLSRKSECM